MPIEYSVQRTADGMTADMAIDLKLFQRIFRGDLRKIYFNSSIHRDAKPYSWAESQGDYPNLYRDGVLIIEDLPVQPRFRDQRSGQVSS